MGNLSNMTISTKIAGLLVLLVLVVMSVAWYGSRTLRAEGSEYNHLTAHSLPSTTRIARGARMAVAMNLSAYRTMVHDGASERAQPSASAEQDNCKKANELFFSIKTDLPSANGVIRRIRNDIERLQNITKSAV